MFWLLLLGGVVYLLAQWLSRPDPPKLIGVYSQPGKFYLFKFYLMKWVITRRKKKSKNSEKGEEITKMSGQFGGAGNRDPKEMDSKSELPLEKKRPVDAVFFDASNKDGWYFTLGVAQRKDNVANLFFIVRIPEKGTFICPEMLTNTNVPSVPGEAWETESGFKLVCEEPMRRWRLTFAGNLVAARGETIFTQNGPEELTEKPELIPAYFDFTWTNFGEAFDFDLDCSPTSIAHSLAIEPWSRALFDRLQESHQMHYEQFGILQGGFKIRDELLTPARMTSMRDHTKASYRSWADIRRYIMMIYHLDDGTCIHTSVISMPETVFTQLEFGYVITADKRKVAVDRIHFELAHHGEDRLFPKQFFYSFDAGDLHYDVEVKVIQVESFKMGLDLASQVNEQMCEYVANGIKGRGFAEVEYRIQPY